MHWYLFFVIEVVESVTVLTRSCNLFAYAANILHSHILLAFSCKCSKIFFLVVKWLSIRFTGLTVATVEQPLMLGALRQARLQQPWGKTNRPKREIIPLHNSFMLNFYFIEELLFCNFPAALVFLPISIIQVEIYKIKVERKDAVKVSKFY